ncbi:glycoside hydrolase family 10 protein [Massilia soli]|uniref:glycoside hydrolase family 10 protein n=1 Tax=Massilia soli TaxID=2792854 RepID=UPI0027D95A11|nr:family 10 glycosylhydrolase [Massilia soli]
MKKRAFALAGIAGAMAMGGLLTSCTSVRPAAPGVATPGADMPVAKAPLTVPAVGKQSEPPAAPREFRAAWVSTVANIDWPTKQNLSAAQQQAEAIAILDRAKAMNMNAIVLQVRPSADAIYPSKLEPWTEYLNGAQGEAPKPWYDPLKFWVTEAHARGLELHAWFNPYRARHATAKSPNVASHISRSNPTAVKTYGKFLWMDPAEESASKQTLDVILDVVRRYDIDGVHLDDYFYPYPIEAPGQTGAEAAALDGSAPKTELDFPDQPAWDRYVRGGGKLDRAHWRRDNVNRLIKEIYAGVHREKSWVRFGISPFGIARPDRRPPTISGFSQYDKLYADAELWLENGWVDYFVPQLYWPISQTPQAYDTLLDYWLAQNPKGRHVWPGLFTSRIGAATRSYAPAEVLKQIQVTRERPAATGHVHFSMAAIMQNREGIADQLHAVHYTVPALVPATPWLGNMAPGTPTVRATRAAGGVKLKMAPGKAAAQYAIWSRHGDQWKFAVAPGAATEFTVADDATLGPASAVFVSAVDRLGNEGKRVSVSGIAAK